MKRKVFQVVSNYKDVDIVFSFFKRHQFISQCVVLVEKIMVLTRHILSFTKNNVMDSKWLQVRRNIQSNLFEIEDSQQGVTGLVSVELLTQVHSCVASCHFSTLSMLSGFLLTASQMHSAQGILAYIFLSCPISMYSSSHNERLIPA